MQVTVKTQITASDGNTYLVSVTYEQDANMPENADLAVRELGDGEKEDYVNQSAEALGTDAENLAFARAFDISLTDPDTGMKVQPASGVRVSVSLLDINLNSIEELRLLHFGEEVETVSYTLNGSAVEFETDGFSVYVLAGYTVDFHWGDYTYSIAGESEILLSALLEKLGVTEITAADVADVAFSEPTLVEVETIKDEAEQTTDWRLRSLAPFHTDEKLTLTLKNGRSVEIKVTDAVTLPASGTWDNGSNGSGTWEIDTSGVLTVSGTGAMKDYNNSPWVGGTPWFEYIVKDSSGSITNCYATGYIDPTAATKYAFVAGALPEESTGNYYYMTINEVPKTGGKPDETEPMLPYSGYVLASNLSSMKPIDLNADTYNTFVGAFDTWNLAEPYDRTSGTSIGLDTYYSGSYTLKTVDELIGAAQTTPTDTPDAPTGYTDWNELFVTTHYGDWPSPEVFFINTEP